MEHLRVFVDGRLCDVHFGHYFTGNIEIELCDYESGEPVAIPTVNLNRKNEPDVVALKIWGANRSVINELKRIGLIGRVSYWIRSCETVVPHFQLTRFGKEELKKQIGDDDHV